MKRWFVFFLAAATWIPVGMVVLFLIRGYSLSFGHMLLRDLFLLAIAGFPLAIPIHLLWARNRRLLTILLGLTLAPVSVLAALTGGLFGPVGILLYTTFVSLPAWFGLGIVRWLESRKKNKAHAG